MSEDFGLFIDQRYNSFSQATENLADFVSETQAGFFNLESSVGQDKVCCCGGAWVRLHGQIYCSCNICIHHIPVDYAGATCRGVTAQNGRSISSSYNNAMRHHSSAIYSVARFTLWVR